MACSLAYTSAAVACIPEQTRAKRCARQHRRVVPQGTLLRMSVDRGLVWAGCASQWGRVVGVACMTFHMWRGFVLSNAAAPDDVLGPNTRGHGLMIVMGSQGECLVLRYLPLFVCSRIPWRMWA